MKIVLWSQVLNGVVLPFVLIFMLLLINKKELMGEYVNTRLFNVVAWSTTVIDRSRLSRGAGHGVHERIGWWSPMRLCHCA